MGEMFGLCEFGQHASAGLVSLVPQLAVLFLADDCGAFPERIPVKLVRWYHVEDARSQISDDLH